MQYGRLSHQIVRNDRGDGLPLGGGGGPSHQAKAGKCPSGSPRVFPYAFPLEQELKDINYSFQMVEIIFRNFIIIKDLVPLIERSRASCLSGRFPPSFIHQVIIITGLNLALERLR